MSHVRKKTLIQREDLRKIKMFRFEKMKSPLLSLSFSLSSPVQRKKYNLYRGSALSLYGALYDVRPIYHRRNLYSNALSISIIGEELLGAHTMAKRLLCSPLPSLNIEKVLRNVCNHAVNVDFIKTI